MELVGGTKELGGSHDVEAGGAELLSWDDDAPRESGGAKEGSATPEEWVWELVFPVKEGPLLTLTLDGAELELGALPALAGMAETLLDPPWDAVVPQPPQGPKATPLASQMCTPSAPVGQGQGRNSLGTQEISPASESTGASTGVRVPHAKPAPASAAQSE